MKQKLLKTMLLLSALVVGSSSVWATVVNVLSEDFSSNNTADLLTSAGWTLSGKTSSQSGWWQIASGSGEGSATTPAFTSLVGSSATLSFKLKSSGSNTNTLTITGVNCKVDGGTSTTKSATSSESTVTIAITNASTTSKITFSAAQNAGCRIDDVVVYYTAGDPGKKNTTVAINTSGLTNTDINAGTAAGTLTATVTPDGGGDALSSPAISWSSSDEEVATIGETTGVVTLVGEGDVTFKATYAGDATYNGSNATTSKFTITDSSKETITFSDKYKSNTTINGTTISATNFSVVFNKSAGSTAPQYYTTGTAVRAYASNNFIVSSEGKKIKKIVLTFGTSDGSNAITTNKGSYSAGTWTGLAKSVKFTIGGSSGNRRISAISVYYSDAVVYPVSVSSAGYTTMVSDFALDFSGVTAYTVTETSSTTVTLNEITAAPANTPVIVQAAADDYDLPILASASSVGTNLLQASDGTVKGDGTNIYALGVGKTGANEDKVGFYLVNDGESVPAGKAYLDLSGSPVKEFLNFDFGEDADGIQTLSDSPLKGENIYNLAGQRLQKMQKGINIVNGKKVLF